MEQANKAKQSNHHQKIHQKKQERGSDGCWRKDRGCHRGCCWPPHWSYALYGDGWEIPEETLSHSSHSSCSTPQDLKLHHSTLTHVPCSIFRSIFVHVPCLNKHNTCVCVLIACWVKMTRWGVSERTKKYERHPHGFFLLSP